MIDFITENIDECLGQPCVNNGTCVDEINGFMCLCPVGYQSTFCEDKLVPILHLISIFLSYVFNVNMLKILLF